MIYEVYNFVMNKSKTEQSIIALDSLLRSHLAIRPRPRTLCPRSSTCRQSARPASLPPRHRQKFLISIFTNHGDGIAEPESLGTICRP